MSDNPEEIGLGLNIDETGFLRADQLGQQIVATTNDMAKASDNLNQVQSQSVSALDRMQDKLSQVQQQQSAQTDNINTATVAIEKQTQAIDSQTEALGRLKTKSEYGVTYGQIGPAEAPEDSGVGSLTSIARAAGRTGTPEGQDVAKILYITQGLRSLNDILGPLNESIIQTGGAIGPLTEGMTALGIPMAGIVVAATAVAGVLALVAAGIAVWNDKLNASKASLKEAVDSVDVYYKAIQSGTTDTVSKALKDAQDKKNADQAALNDLQKQYDSGLAQARNLAGPVGGSLFEANNGDLRKAIDDHKKAVTDDQAAIDGNQRALTDNSLAANDAAAAQAELTKVQNAAAAQALQDTVTWESTLGRLKATGTQNSLDSLTGSLKGQAAGDQENINKFQSITGPLSPGEAEALKAAKDDLALVNQHLADLANIIQPLVTSGEEAAKALKDQKQATDDINKSIEAYGKAVDAAEAALANNITNAQTREKNAEEQYTQGSMQDVQARAAIDIKESRDEIKVKQDTANAIIDIGTKLSNADIQIATDSARRKQDEEVKFTDDDAKLRLDYDRSQQSDLTDHLNKLSDIQQQAHRSDQMALLYRNFLQLAKNNEGNHAQVAAEDTAYAQREQKLQVHLAQQEADLVTNEKIQQQQDAVNDQRKRDDAQRAADISIEQQNTAETRKLQLLRSSEVQQINDLSAMETYKIQLLQAGLKNEITLYQDQEAQRIAIAQDTASKIQQDAYNRLTGTTPDTNTGAVGYSPYAQGSRGFAAGGTFGPGQGFEMQEGSDTESLNIGGAAYGLKGRAFVYPLQGGYVQPNASGKGSGNSYNITIPVSGAGMQPDQVATLVVRKLEGAFSELLGINNG